MPTKNMAFTSAVSAPKDKYRVGATAHSSDQPEIEFEVVESHENMRITYHVKELNMDMDTSAILEPVDEGTRMTYVADMELRSFLMKVVGRLLQGMGENEMENSLKKLKSLLER